MPCSTASSQFFDPTARLPFTSSSSGYSTIPSPLDREEILLHLGFTYPATKKILGIYNNGLQQLRFNRGELVKFPLVSCLFRSWEMGHQWDYVSGGGTDTDTSVEFAIRNGLTQEAAEEIAWSIGEPPEEAVRRFVANRVRELKLVWEEEGKNMRDDRNKRGKGGW